jgi:hypothetical protein
MVYLPTMGRIGDGIYRAVEPVAVVSASDIDGIRRALEETIARGNPTARLLRRSEYPPPLLLKYAAVKSWPAFERGMTFWIVKEEDGVFQIAGQSKRSDGGWRSDPKRTIVFSPTSTTDNVIDRMIGIVQEAAKNPKNA